jgi:hypothetical protein
VTTRHPRSAGDRYDQQVSTYEATIRRKVVEQGNVTYKSPLWREIQAEIDDLTAEKRQFEQALPAQRAHDDARDVIMGLGGFAVAALATAGFFFGWFPAWVLVAAAAGVVLGCWAFGKE